MNPISENSASPWTASDNAPLTPQQIDLRHAHNLLERATNHVDADEIDKALLACRQALHLAPQSFPVRSLLAMLLRRNGELDEAILQSEKALELIPEHLAEQARLAALKAARENTQPAPALQAGEWDQFRLELQREVKLSQMLDLQLAAPAPAALAEPLPFINDPLLPEPVVSPVFEPPVKPALNTPGLQPKRYLYLFCVGTLAAVLSFLVVRSLQPKPAPLPPPAQPASAVQMTDNPPPGQELPQETVPALPPGSEEPTPPTDIYQPPAPQAP